MEQAALTNRELSALIILGVLVAMVFSRPQKNEMATSLRGIIDALVKPAIVVPIVLYALWVAVAVAAAAKVGVWNSELLKATILWFLLSGLAVFMNINTAISKPGFFKGVLFKTMGVAALLEFLTALKSFPLWLEIPAQALATVFAMISVVPERRSHNTPARKLATGYLAVFGFGAMIWSIAFLIRDWSELDHRRLIGDFLLPVWLTPVALLFIYWFALYAAYEVAFLRMRMWNKSGSLFLQRLALVLRANLRLGYLRHLSGFGAHRIGKAKTFLEAWQECGALRREARVRAAEEVSTRQRLVRNAGARGTDDSGQQLDQQEFEETRTALRWLATSQMGHYRSGDDGYRADLLPIVEPHFAHDGLPEDHGVEMYVSSDGQSWYATRQTITGWWFAIGATGPPADQWLYDGPAPPTGFPSVPEWDHFGGGSASLNWD